MFKNYLKTAIQNLKRYKGYSFINLMGLAIGISCCIIILIYMQDEFSYDRYTEDYEQIYRITLTMQALLTEQSYRQPANSPRGSQIHVLTEPTAIKETIRLKYVIPRIFNTTFSSSIPEPHPPSSLLPQCP